MIKQPNDHHLCALCGAKTHTLHGRPCVVCQKRIAEQTKRYLFCAGIMADAMLIDFGTFDKKEKTA